VWLHAPEGATEVRLGRPWPTCTFCSATTAVRLPPRPSTLAPPRRLCVTPECRSLAQHGRGSPGHICPLCPPPGLSRTVSDSECRREPKEWRTSEEDGGVGRQSEGVRVGLSRPAHTQRQQRQAGQWTTVSGGCARSCRPWRPRAAHPSCVYDSYLPPRVVVADVCAQDRMATRQCSRMSARGALTASPTPGTGG